MSGEFIDEQDDTQPIAHIEYASKFFDTTLEDYLKTLVKKPTVKELFDSPIFKEAFDTTRKLVGNVMAEEYVGNWLQDNVDRFIP